MNLLLTSCGLETETIRQAFLQMLRKPAGQTKALFIPTAANSPDAVEVLPKCLGDLLRCDIPLPDISTIHERMSFTVTSAHLMSSPLELRNIANCSRSFLYAETV